MPEPQSEIWRELNSQKCGCNLTEKAATSALNEGHLIKEDRISLKWVVCDSKAIHVL